MATVTLRPIANISAECSQYPTSGYNYDKVDEEESDGDSTYVYAPSAAPGDYRDLYDIPSSGIPAGSTINSVTVYIVVRATGSPGRSTSVATRLRTYGTVYETLFVIKVGATYVTRSATYTTNPYTGQPWTVDEVNSMDIGVMCRDIYLEPYDAAARCTQCYAVVDYTPPAVVAPAQLGEGLTFVG
jgi:hypothetical protein